MKIKRMQELAGISSPDKFKIVLDPGEIEDEDLSAVRIQTLYYDKEEDDWFDVDESLNFSYLNKLGINGIWLLDSLERYEGVDFYPNTITHIDDEGQMRYYGEHVYEFDSVKKVEDFLKRGIKNIIQDFL